MAYVTQDEILAGLPDEWRTAALDDEQRGEETPGLWALIADEASRHVDAILSARYSTPLDPVPAAAHVAALYFALEMLITRRRMEHKGISEAAERSRKLLGEIAAGARPLDCNTEEIDASAAIVTEPARMHSSSGRLTL